MSNKNFSKSKIIYNRLYKEYGGWDSVEEFMSVFGLARQSYYDKQKSEKIDYDEIKKALPEVNTEWLFSDNEYELKNLSVRNRLTKQTKEKSNSRSQFDLLNEEIIDYDSKVTDHIKLELLLDDPLKTIEYAEGLIRIARLKLENSRRD